MFVFLFFSALHNTVVSKQTNAERQTTAKTKARLMKNRGVTFYISILLVLFAAILLAKVPSRSAFLSAFPNVKLFQHSDIDIKGNTRFSKLLCENHEIII